MIEILNTRILRGPNYFSGGPVIVFRVHLREYDEVFTDELPEFVKSLLKLVPSLWEHRCSPGVPGGFVTRLREGTLLGHVMEHTSLELQNLAGMEVGFGKARSTKEQGVYNIIFGYLDEAAGLYAGNTAFRIISTLLNEEEYLTLEEDIQKLKDLRETNLLGPSTTAIVEEANKRNIPTIRLDEYNLVQLGYGKYQRCIRATLTDNTSQISVETAQDKALTKRILADAGIPIPLGYVITTLEEAIEKADLLGRPVVLKPVSGSKGEGVTPDVESENGLKRAFERANVFSDNLIIEKYIKGNDYRLLVVNGEMVAASLRTAPFVIGDGEHTIKELIDIANQSPERGFGREKALSFIIADDMTEWLLEWFGYTFDTILPIDEKFYLQMTSSSALGGSAEDVTDLVHPDNKSLVERASRVIGLDIAGVDVIASTLESPLIENGGVIVEINVAPDLRIHLNPSKGNKRNVAIPIVDMLYHNNTPSTIPIIAITGTNGKTTISRLIAHIMHQVGYEVGLTTTDGMYINNRMIAKGNYAGLYGTQIILRDPTIDCAILEISRIGLLRDGLGYDKADVGIVLNVTEDHLGSDDIDDLEDLAYLKSLISERIKDDSYAILNADDELVVEMASKSKGKIAYFSLDAQNPIIQEHINNGGLAAVYEDAYIKILQGEHKRRLMSIYEIPITYDGKAFFNIQTALAATLSAYVQGVSYEDIRIGLGSFFLSPMQLPGRLTFLKMKDFSILVDTSHNASAYETLSLFLKQIEKRNCIGIIEASGIHTDEELLRLGEIAGHTYNELIFYEETITPNRPKGEIINLLREGAIKSGIAERYIRLVNDSEKALYAGLDLAQKDDLIVILTGQAYKTLAWLFAYKKQEEPVIIPEMKNRHG